jgi:hypothetical protein
VLKLCFEIEGKVGKVGKVEEIKKFGKNGRQVGMFKFRK